MAKKNFVTQHSYRIFLANLWLLVAFESWSMWQDLLVVDILEVEVNLS
jgi:hypothetical protein